MDLLRKKSIEHVAQTSQDLLRCLSAFDLTLMGIGAIIGAGIFVITGVAAAMKAGPAIILSYVIAGFACLFSALAYAELAASIGGCGSAYGYAFVGFGEIIAWIVGWDLLLEYAISIAAVAVGWGSYVNDFLFALNIPKPYFFLRAPFAGLEVNFLAVLIIIFLAGLLMLGVEASKRMNNMIVVFKLLVIGLFIVIAAAHMDPKNWTPFMPFGWVGVAQGASLIFFAYLGFDAVSTSAEEAINPQRSLPIGIVGSLLVSTILYILVSGLLTGIVSYQQLNVASPISYALILIGYKTTAGLISVGAIAGLSTVILVLFYGLSRIFFAMARDGLLPRFFSAVNSKTQTPIRIILLCALVVGLAAGLLPIQTLADLVNIGTLFAFILVCSGVLLLRYFQPKLPRPFKTPFMPYTPILGIISCLYLIFNLPWFTIWRFIIWFILGIVIYFVFARKHSILNGV